MGGGGLGRGGLGGGGRGGGGRLMGGGGDALGVGLGGGGLAAGVGPTGGHTVLAGQSQTLSAWGQGQVLGSARGLNHAAHQCSKRKLPQAVAPPQPPQPTWLNSSPVWQV